MRQVSENNMCRVIKELLEMYAYYLSLYTYLHKVIQHNLYENINEKLLDNILKKTDSYISEIEKHKELWNKLLSEPVYGVTGADTLYKELIRFKSKIEELLEDIRMKQSYIPFIDILTARALLDYLNLLVGVFQQVIMLNFLKEK